MEETDKINKQLKDLRMDYDELTDWVSELHHKLDNHIREFHRYVEERNTRYIEEHKKITLSSKIKKFFNKYRNVISILLGIGVLLACILLSSLRICGLI